MTQKDILDLLNSEPDKWFSSKDIQGRLNISISTIQVLLKKLKKSKFLEFTKDKSRSRYPAYLYKSHTGTKK